MIYIVLATGETMCMLDIQAIGGECRHEEMNREGTGSEKWKVGITIGVIRKLRLVKEGILNCLEMQNFRG